MKQRTHARSTFAMLTVLVTGIALFAAPRAGSALRAATIDTIDYLLTLVAPTVQVPCPGAPEQMCDAPDSSSPMYFLAPQGVAYDAAGRLYVSDTNFSDVDPTLVSDRVRVFGPGHNYLYDIRPSVASGPFYYPVGLAVDAGGRLLVADAGNDRLVLFNAATDDTTPPAELMATGVHGNFDPLDHESEDRQTGVPPLNPLTLWYPTSIAIKPGTHMRLASENPADPTADLAGRVAVVDNSNHRVVVLDSTLTPIYAFGGHALGTVDSPLGFLEYPWGIAIDAAGLYYVADSENNRIQVFREITDAQGQPQAQFVRVFGSAFTPDPADANHFIFGSDPGDMARPYGLSFDSKGRLLVADPDNHRIMRIDVQQQAGPNDYLPCSLVQSDQSETHCIVTASDGSHYDTLVLGARGSGTDALFQYPQDIAESPTHGLAIADTDNNAVQLFTSAALSVNFQGPGTIDPGPHPVHEPFTFSVTLVNDGGLAAAATVIPTASVDGVFTGVMTQPIAAASAQVFTFTFTPNEPGPLSITVSASAVADVSVGGRLEVGSLTLDGGVVPPSIGLSATATASRTTGGLGDNLSVTVHLRNTGETALSNVAASVVADDPALLQATGAPTGPITLGSLGTGTWTFTYTLAQTGAATLAVTASASYVDPIDGVTKPLTSSAQPLHVTIVHDAMPPVVTLTVSPVPSTGWYNDAFPVRVSATDEAGGSGIASVSFRIVQENATQTVAGSVAEFMFNRQGNTTIEYYAVDNAGNRSATMSLAVKEDAVPPDMGAPIVSPERPASGWYRADPTITFVAGDSAGGSGLSVLTPPVTVTTNGANQTKTGVAVDYAGNSSVTASATVNVDKIAPSLVCAPSRAPNASLWYRSSVSVSCLAADQLRLSGMQSLRVFCDATVTGVNAASCTFATEGVHTFLAEATDVAGNLSTKTIDIRIDRTAPVLACRVSATPIVWPPNHKMVQWNPVVSVTDAVSAATFKLVDYYSNDDDDGHGDGHSNDDMIGWTLNTPDTSGYIRAERTGRTARTYTLRYAAADQAGNTATCSLSVTVPPSQGHDNASCERDHDGRACDDRSHHHSSRGRDRDCDYDRRGWDGR